MKRSFALAFPETLSLSLPVFANPLKFYQFADLAEFNFEPFSHLTESYLAVGTSSESLYRFTRFEDVSDFGFQPRPHFQTSHFAVGYPLEDLCQFCNHPRRYYQRSYSITPKWPRPQTGWPSEHDLQESCLCSTFQPSCLGALRSKSEMGHVT